MPLLSVNTGGWKHKRGLHFGLGRHENIARKFVFRQQVTIFGYCQGFTLKLHIFSQAGVTVFTSCRPQRKEISGTSWWRLFWSFITAVISVTCKLGRCLFVTGILCRQNKCDQFSLSLIITRHTTSMHFHYQQIFSIFFQFFLVQCSRAQGDVFKYLVLSDEQNKIQSIKPSHLRSYIFGIFCDKCLEHLNFFLQIHPC